MATVAERFYPTKNADDQAFSGEVQIRDVQEAATGLNETFGTITWTTTTITEKTWIPSVANSANGDQSNNSGYAFNNGGADGMGSTSTAKRLLVAGVWTFRIGMTMNTPALLDTHALTITAKVYRVATGGGTRTLLFTATSANQTGTANVQWDSASQPEYVLQAGEVIMVGYTATSASTTALVLGANTNTVLTFFINGETWFEVPTPGVRTQYLQSLADNSGASDALARQMLFPRVLADSSAVVDALIRSVVNARSLNDSAGIPSDSLVRVMVYGRSLADSAPASDAITRVFTGARSLADSSAVSDALTRQFIGARSMSDSAGIPNDSLTRVATFPRALVDVAGADTDSLFRTAIFNRSITDVAGIPTDLLARVFTGARSFTDSASVNDALTRQFAGARALSDASPASDVLARVAIYNRSVEDNAGIPNDSLIRQATYNRALPDEAGADADVLERIVIYARTLEDSLSEGGGTTIRPVVFLVDD